MPDTPVPPQQGAHGAPFLCEVPIAAAPGCGDHARRWAEAYGLTFLGEVPLPPVNPGYVLWCDQQGLALRATGKDAPGPVRVDFAAGRARHRRLYGGGRSQDIAKAVGLRDRRDLHVADLTAGLGADSFALACLGARVSLLERHPAVAALLADGLGRARTAAAEDPAMAAIVERMSVDNCDARQWLAGRCEKVDVVYLDPMFPERRKSAQVNKEMQAFQAIVGADWDADALLEPALATARFRVVVKRPARAPRLAGKEPAYSLIGKAVRFDVYALTKIG